MRLITVFLLTFMSFSAFAKTSVLIQPLFFNNSYFSMGSDLDSICRCYGYGYAVARSAFPLTNPRLVPSKAPDQNGVYQPTKLVNTNAIQSQSDIVRLNGNIVNSENGAAIHFMSCWNEKGVSKAPTLTADQIARIKAEEDAINKASFKY